MNHKCVTCKKEKPETDFTKNKSKKTGISSQCKQCRHDYRQANKSRLLEYSRWYEENIRKDRVDYFRDYGIKNRAKLTEKERERRPKVREKTRRNSKRWRENNKIKVAAHNAVKRAYANGSLLKQPCEICGLIDVEAHHDDYNKPLDVRFLCKVHHNLWHRENGEGKL